MTADRPYRAAMSHDAARDELRACSGTQFDPEVVEAFLRVLQPGSRTAHGVVHTGCVIWPKGGTFGRNRIRGRERCEASG